MAYIKFWGVRGSIPTPGPSTVRYGGNTPCVELKYDDENFFILDAGSGIREFGQYLLKTGKPVKTHIFISHMHWDHIQGIPFFVPAYIPGNEFIFHGAQEADFNLKDILAEQMNPVNFPVQFQEMASHFRFVPMYEGLYLIANIAVETIYLNHPGFALGYKFSVKNKSLTYISDNEPYPHFKAAENINPDNIDDAQYVEDNNKRIVNFAKNSDILVHDAQYTPEEYKTKVTWGHSSYEFTVQVALDAGVKTLVLFHHDPIHNDVFIDGIVEKAQNLAKEKGSNLQILAASEGLVIPLD